jgi:hypothetical protein
LKKKYRDKFITIKMRMKAKSSNCKNVNKCKTSTTIEKKSSNECITDVIKSTQTKEIKNLLKNRLNNLLIDGLYDKIQSDLIQQYGEHLYLLYINHVRGQPPSANDMDKKIEELKKIYNVDIDEYLNKICKYFYPTSKFFTNNQIEDSSCDEIDDTNDNDDEIERDINRKSQVQMDVVGNTTDQNEKEEDQDEDKEENLVESELEEEEEKEKVKEEIKEEDDGKFECEWCKTRYKLKKNNEMRYHKKCFRFDKTY